MFRVRFERELYKGLPGYQRSSSAVSKRDDRRFHDKSHTAPTELVNTQHLVLEGGIRVFC